MDTYHTGDRNTRTLQHSRSIGNTTRIHTHGTTLDGLCEFWGQVQLIENVVSYGFDRFRTQPLHFTSRIVSRERGEIDLSHTLQQPCCLPLLLYTSTSSDLRTTSLHSTQILHGILSNPSFVVRKHRNPLVGESGCTLVLVPAQGLVLCRNLDIRTLDMIRL